MGSEKKIYYSMGQVAEMLDVSPSLLRFWEGKFSQIKPHKNAKGNRLFTPQDVDNLKLIYHLVKERGMTLAGAQKVLRGERKGVESNAQLLERLQTIRALLEEIRQELGGEEGEVFVDTRDTTMAPAPVMVEVVKEARTQAREEAPFEPSPEPLSEPSSEPLLEAEPAPEKPRILEQTLF